VDNSVVSRLDLGVKVLPRFFLGNFLRMNET
jgi:hypothetical protein